MEVNYKRSEMSTALLCTGLTAGKIICHKLSTVLMNNNFKVNSSMENVMIVRKPQR